MFLKRTPGPRTVVLPDGRILSLADLPGPRTRWVASRKEVVVNAVRYGLLGREEALQRYALTDEELDAWDAAFLRHGQNALKATKLQHFRQS